MKAPECCRKALASAAIEKESDAESARNRLRPTIVSRALGLVRWLLPAAIFALLPKCPLCIAAYIALATGIGISVTTASYVRTLLLAVSLTVLAYLAVRHLAHLISGKARV